MAEEQAVMDRRPEIEAFECMLDGDDPQHRLMLVVGDHGQGKTWLMRIFERRAVERQIPCLKLDLSSAIEFNDILDGIWWRLGPHRFPRYSLRRERAGQMEHQTPEEQRQELTACFFADWKAIEESTPTVVLLDTYERAVPTLQNWVEHTFLKELQYVEQAVILIGGRQWPLIDDYWLTHGYRFPLEGVQLRDYRRYAEQRGVAVKEAELIQLHRTMRGLPKLFVEYIDAQAQRGV